MKIEQLVSMANQIGAFFESDGRRERAISEIANHLKKFWDPRMRRQILGYVAENGGVGLTDIVRDAILGNRDLLGGDG